MKRIVVIEDNTMAAKLYESTLVREGFEVELASDGEAGLAAIARAAPSLVLLDLMLPKIGGFEVLRRIRAMPGLETLPVIVTSNAYTASRLDELRRAGATQIVTKASMSPKELTRIIQQALQPLSPG
jgi:CheY-like chemotaxis protein